MNIAYYCEVCLHVSGASAKGMRIYIWRKISKLLDFSLYKPEWYYEYSNPCLSVHFALMMVNFQSCTFYTDKKKFPALKYEVNLWICIWWGKYYFSSNPHRTFMSPNICSLNQMHDEWVFFLLSLYWAIVITLFIKVLVLHAKIYITIKIFFWCEIMIYMLRKDQ